MDVKSGVMVSYLFFLFPLSHFFPVSFRLVLTFHRLTREVTLLPLQWSGCQREQPPTSLQVSSYPFISLPLEVTLYGTRGDTTRTLKPHSHHSVSTILINVTWEITKREVVRRGRWWDVIRDKGIDSSLDSTGLVYHVSLGRFLYFW